MSKFRKGDRVVDKHLGSGTVAEISEIGTVAVLFDNPIGDTYHSVWIDPMNLTLSKLRPIAAGDLVEFSDGTRGRVGSRMEGGFMVCFANGGIRTLATEKELTLVQ